MVKSLVVAAVLLGALAIAGSASARPVSSALPAQEFKQTGVVWYFHNTVNCAGTEGAIADGPLQVSAEAFLQYPDPSGGGCGGAFPAPKNAGTGDMGVKWVLQKAAFNTNDWKKCEERAWKYNLDPTSYLQAVRQWSDPTPCGSAKYRMKSVAKYRTGDGVWHEGSVTTAYIVQ